jgi:protein transport protein SEC23
VCPIGRVPTCVRAGRRRNVWPSSRIDATRVVVPFGSMVTPIKTIPGMPLLPYEPVGCKSCRAVLNPYCRVDFVGKIWICPFCLQRNQFPRNYADINETNLPAELFPQYTTVEYQVRIRFHSHSSTRNPSSS